jgi:hypothetical protein
MKITKEVKVDFASAYCGWNYLEITDVDGTEVKIKLTDEQWLDLGGRVGDKANNILKKRADEMQDTIDEKVDAKVQELLANRKEIEFNE